MNRDFLTGIAIAAVAGLFVSLAVISQNQAASQETEHTVTRDTVTVLLDHKAIPAKDFIHLYDATPYHIMNGHVAAKLPCDSNSETELAVVVGQAPNVEPVEMEILAELSKPGSMCIYHVDLPPEGMEHAVTDIALLNTTDKVVRLPRTSTVVIGVNEIMPLGEEAHGEH
jgi:hypothetical protein